MKNVALTGMMGCGKSSVAKELQKLLSDYVCIEMDFEIEKQENKTINEIFALHGETYFRNLETKLIEQVSANKNLIISMGGGAFLKEENRKLFLENSICIYLKTEPKTIYERIKADNSRPLLKSNDVFGKINELLNERARYYNQAHHIVITDNKKPEDIAKEILEIYIKYGN